MLLSVLPITTTYLDAITTNILFYLAIDTDSAEFETNRLLDTLNT
jgi:hypothetical protein